MALPLDQPLVQPNELTDFADEAIPAGVVKAAAGQLRVDAGWHIAPEIVETVRLSVRGERVLVLPTRRLVEVLSVKGMYGDTVPPSEYEVNLAEQTITRHYGTWGYGTVQVEMQHGFPDCPAELLPVIVARCHLMRKDPTVKQWSQTEGPFSRSETAHDVFAAGSPGALPPRYAVTPGF